MDWDEYISIVMLVVTNTVMEYEPKNKNFDWSELNIVDSRSFLILNSLINKIINSRLSDAQRAIEYKKPTEITIEGSTYLALIDTSPDSTDAIIIHENGKTNLIQTLGTDSKFGYQHSLYHPSHFLEYFNKNRYNSKHFLTNKQKEYIKVQQKFLHEDGSNYTKPYSHDPTQPYKERNRLQYRETIRNRITKKYYEDFPNGDEITLLQMKKESDLQLLNELMTIVYHLEYDDVGELNESITNWIHEQLNNASTTIVSDLLHDELGVSELIHMNTAIHNGFIVNNKVIYKIVRLIEGKIEQLENFDTTVKQERAANTSGWTKEDHQRYADYLHSFKNQPIKVYDFKTGKLLRKENYVPEQKNYKVFRLDTHGLRHELGEHDVGID